MKENEAIQHKIWTSKKPNKGFTLIEAMIAVSILSLLGTFFIKSAIGCIKEAKKISAQISTLQLNSAMEASDLDFRVISKDATAITETFKILNNHTDVDKTISEFNLDESIINKILMDNNSEELVELFKEETSKNNNHN